MTEPVKFDIIWRAGAYYVTIPNYKGGTVYTAEYVGLLVEALAGYDRFISVMHEMAGENGYKSGIALAQERCRKELDRIDSVMSRIKDAVGESRD